MATQPGDWFDSDDLEEALEARDNEIIALHADLEEVAVAAKPFLGGSAPYHRRPAGMDVAQYEQQCATALVKALARPGVVALLEGVKDG